MLCVILGPGAFDPLRQTGGFLLFAGYLKARQYRLTLAFLAKLNQLMLTTSKLLN